jgi:hypothetical protein
MPLINDVLDQLGESAWFTTLDFQSRFWHIPMASGDIKKTIVITKSCLYEWSIMSFILKNVTSTFGFKLWHRFLNIGTTNS